MSKKQTCKDVLLYSLMTYNFMMILKGLGGVARGEFRKYNENREEGYIFFPSEDSLAHVTRLGSGAWVCETPDEISFVVTEDTETPGCQRCLDILKRDSL